MTLSMHTDPVRPLIHTSKGVYITACGRFKLLHTSNGWWIAAARRDLRDAHRWLHSNGLHAQFARRRDIVEALEAHLAITECHAVPISTLSWKRVSPDEFDSSWYRIIRVNGRWRLYNTKGQYLAVTRTLRAAKHVAAEFAVRFGPPAEPNRAGNREYVQSRP